MNIDVNLIKNQDQPTTAWSGGTTTQIAIYPAGAVYSERNFKWRLSTARVDQEESVFTSLPGIQRLIMVLDGHLKINHDGHHSVSLNPFEQDKFSGDWTTRSLGKARDFNLMLAAGCEGSLTALTLEPAAANDQLVGSATGAATTGFYCVSGLLEVSVGDQQFTMETGDFLLLKSSIPAVKAAAVLHNRSTGPAYVVRVDIGCE